MIRVRTRSSDSGSNAAFGVLLAGALFALVAGAGTAIVGPYAAAAFSAVLLGISALFLPIRWLVVALIVVSFLITGQLIYFARIEKALWFPFLVGALILVRYPLDRMQSGNQPEHVAKQMPKAPAAIKIFIGLYFATLAASTLINAAPPMQILVSSKEFFFLWGLYLVLATGLIRPELVARIWGMLPWLMLLQLPLVMYQRFVVMPRRIGVGAAWDAVVGAFGGDPMGGGSSGAMGMFCVIGIVTVIARWRQGLMSGWQATLLALSGLLGIGMAEIKFMVLLLPIAFGLFFIRDLARRPIQGVLFIGLGFALALAVLEGYKLQYSHKTTQTTGEYFESMFSASTDSDFVNMRTREIGRIAAIRFWSKRHGIEDPMHLLIGHGAGSSRVGERVIGEAAKPFPFNISRSALAMLLWETGLVGTLSFVGILGTAFLALFRQSGESERDAESKATLGPMSVAVVMLAAGLPYNTDLLYSHQIQVLLMLCLGYAAMMNANGLPPSRPTATPHWRQEHHRVRP